MTVTSKVGAVGDHTSDPWLARARLSLYVGEVENVIFGIEGDARNLVLDDGIIFAIPANMAGAAWSRLRSGDMVCIRHGRSWIGDMLAVASVDAMDGQTSIADTELGQDSRYRDSRKAGAPPSACTAVEQWPLRCDKRLRNITHRSSERRSLSVSHDHV